MASPSSVFITAAFYLSLVLQASFVVSLVSTTLSGSEFSTTISVSSIDFLVRFIRPPHGGSDTQLEFSLWSLDLALPMRKTVRYFV